MFNKKSDQIMKELVERIKAEYEEFAANAEAQVERVIRLQAHAHVRLLLHL